MYHKKVYLNIGNSFMVAGFFRKKVFVPLKRVPSGVSSFKKLSVLTEKNCGLIVVASVVPELLKAAVKKYKKRALVILNTNVPVINLYENKKTAGIDRLLISLGAVKKYGVPCLVIDFAKKVVGRNTKDCIKAGVFYGYVEMINGLIRRVREETGETFKVIATGGWGKLFSPYIKEISVYEPYLIFYGMGYTKRRKQ